MTEAREVKLKPCPWCGNDRPSLIKHEAPDGAVYADLYRVTCGECCEVEHVWDDVKSEAIKVWNTRPAEQELVDALRENNRYLEATRSLVVGLGAQATLLALIDNALAKNRALLTKHDGGKQ